MVTRCHLFLIALTLGSFSLSISGCQNESSRYPLSGRVTYKGQPVPEGTIVFMAVGQKDVQGTPGYAVIKEGQFNSSEGGMGHFGGLTDLSITGFDGQGKSEDSPQGKPLFQTMNVRKTLETKPGVLDIELN